jgi:hypothetical protein
MISRLQSAVATESQRFDMRAAVVNEQWAAVCLLPLTAVIAIVNGSLSIDTQAQEYESKHPRLARVKHTATLTHSRSSRFAASCLVILSVHVAKLDSLDSPLRIEIGSMTVRQISANKVYDAIVAMQAQRARRENGRRLFSTQSWLVAVASHLQG